MAGVVRGFEFFPRFEDEWDFIEREKLRARMSVVNRPLSSSSMRALAWLRKHEFLKWLWLELAYTVCRCVRSSNYSVHAVDCTAAYVGL